MLLRGHTAGLTRVLVSPNGLDLITVGEDGKGLIYDLEIGDCVLQLEGHTAGIRDAAISSDGRLLVTASADHTARYAAHLKCCVHLRERQTVPKGVHFVSRALNLAMQCALAC